MLSTILGFFSSDKELNKALSILLGFRPKNISIYKLALIHRSAGKKLEDGSLISNERLEFLGDAVLSAAVAKYIFKRYPFENEGFLTETRSKIVSRKNLNGLARRLGIADLVTKNSVHNRSSSSLGGDALEALVGAIFLDRGYNAAEKFILDKLIDNFVDIEKLLKEDANFKSKLIEWCQREKKQVAFEVISETIDGHKPSFTISATIDQVSYGEGTDRTKKRAEQAAAKEACAKLNIFK
ncbi:ribonuclease III [Bacteroidota bacterium]